MAITKVIFADVSDLKLGTDIIEGANSFQASRGADTRPIYAFGDSLPALVLSSPVLGNGSFSFIANGTAVPAYKTLLDGTKDIVCTGRTLPTGATQVVTCQKAMFAGQSISMNAKNEMVVNVNFTFADGTF